MDMTASETFTEAGRDFIRDIVAADLAAKRYAHVVTRFPPEPNGYLHIGHAKSIALNFGIAEEFGGRCHLRFDDTNPTKEEQEYIDAIKRDVRWLGYDWGTHLYHASDYFEQLYEWAEWLIRVGKAYVDDQSQDEMRANRGTLTEPGRNSPWRERTTEENFDLLRRMRAGEFPNGARVLRAKIDMASGNINLRDPVLYRILHARIRGPPASVRLVPRTSPGSVSTAAVRIRASQSHTYGAVQAGAHRIGAWRARQRLGRSAHADAGRASPPWRPGGGGARFRQAGRGRQGQQRGRHRHVRFFGPRGPQPDGLAPDGRPASAEDRHRELSGRPFRGHRSGQPSRQPWRGDTPLAFRPRALCRARRFHGEPAEEVLSALARTRGSAALRLFRYLSGGGEKPGRRSG